MAEKVQKTQDEILREFRECVSRLRHLCEQFELGNREFAPLIAVAIYHLVVDGGRGTKSLLLQLKRKDKDFLSTRLPTGPKKSGYAPLVRMSAWMSNQPGDTPKHSVDPVFWCFHGHGYTPESPGPEAPDWERKPFADWWTETVLVHTDRSRLSRKEIVCAMTDRLGGRHSDAAIAEAEADLLREPGLSAKVSFFGTHSVDVNMREVHIPYVRQIAYELQRTLDERCNDLLQNSLATVPPKLISELEDITGDEEQRLAALVLAGKGYTGIAEKLRAVLYWQSRAPA